MNIEWKDVSTIPKDGKLLVVQRGPTNWAPYIYTIVLHYDDPVRLTEIRLKYVTAWAEFPTDL